VLDELVFAAATPWAEALQLKDVRREIGSIYSGTFTREELREGIEAWSANWHAKQTFVRHQVEHGIWTVTVKNGVSSTSVALSNADRAEIHAAAERILASGERIPLPNVTGDVPPAGLLVTLLRQTNTVEFTGSLPPPDIDLPGGGLMEECYSESLKRRFLQSFFEKAVASLAEAASGLFGPIVQEYRPFLGGPLTIIWNLELSPNVLGQSGVTYALGSSSVGADVAVESRGPIKMLSDDSVQGIDGSNLKPNYVTEMAFSSLLTSSSKGHKRRNWAATPIFDWVLGELGAILSKDLFLEAFSRR
jgi:hypothetical protein